MERDEPMKAYDNDGWDIPLYLFEKFDSLSHFAETYPTLSEAAHPDDVFVEAQSSSLTWQMILGPEGSGAGEHFHLAAINFLVVGGVKQWFITSPEISGFSNLHPKVRPDFVRTDLGVEVPDFVRTGCTGIGLARALAVLTWPLGLVLLCRTSPDFVSLVSIAPPALPSPAFPCHPLLCHALPYTATYLRKPLRTARLRSRPPDNVINGVHYEGCITQEGRHV
mmetsp:Transcript_7630/g.19565  ORF Transcript_7630/g.19565 Transcript_7630/m.19565 type:complete len:223 (+) Transcript_7630:657-1325(+)